MADNVAATATANEGAPQLPTLTPEEAKKIGRDTVVKHLATIYDFDSDNASEVFDAEILDYGKDISKPRGKYFFLMKCRCALCDLGKPLKSLSCKSVSE